MKAEYLQKLREQGAALNISLVSKLIDMQVIHYPRSCWGECPVSPSRSIWNSITARRSLIRDAPAEDLLPNHRVDARRPASPRALVLKPFGVLLARRNVETFNRLSKVNSNGDQREALTAIASSMRLLCLSWILLTAGCASRVTPGASVPSLSHIWIAEPPRNAWSYLRVATLRTADGRTSRIDAHVPRQLQPGESVVFENGTSVSYEGKVLRVGNEALDSLNAVVNRDGSVNKGSFIRTFE